MASGTVWKGNIHFGNIDVAVKLHPAVREERIAFHLLHSRDHARLRQQLICAYEKKPVPADEQVKGFEVEEGKFLLVDPGEIDQTSPKSSRSIEVHEFVRTGQIEPVFLGRAYHLEPDGGPKAYAALASALKELDAAGICTWIMRKQSYFGALRPAGKGLRLNILMYADEVIPVKSLGLQKIPVTAKELEIGSELINHLTAPFQPQRFKDEHRIKLEKLIDKKTRGEKVSVMRPRRLKPTGPDRLLEALEASLKRVA